MSSAKWRPLSDRDYKVNPMSEPFRVPAWDDGVDTVKDRWVSTGDWLILQAKHLYKSLC